MKISLSKTINGLIPTDAKAIEVYNKIPLGKEILVDYKKSRNVRFHRKLFALIKIIFENQEHYNDENNILNYIKLKTGHFDTLVTHAGDVAYIPKSIAFENMDDLEFEKFYNKTVDIAFEIAGIEEKELTRLIGFI